MANVPRTLAHDSERADGALQLLVVEGEAVAAYDLPASGSLLVGRGGESDISLAHPSTSARHAQLRIAGGLVTIADLGSRNGVQVRGQRITPDEEVNLAPGEAALLGASVLVVQRSRHGPARRRLWRHGYFEARLTEECDLALDGAPSFSVARIDLDVALPSDAVVEVASRALRPLDVLGAYGPRAFEVLIRRATPEVAQRTIDSLSQLLTARGVAVRSALAHFPADGRTADSLVEKACARLRPAAGGKANARRVIVADEAVRAVYQLAEKAARGTINVLIFGETGTGKEVLADTIHRTSKRADRPFLCLNCAALTENLLESELFGHERGAFTDAKTAKPGLLEAASGGTVFLDEIGEMSPALQAKLLRVIETKQVTRVGGLQPIAIDVRFVSATHRDLVQEIREKRFRSDLYYRLNGLRLELPPLRRRRAEIRPLCEAFLEQLAAEAGMARAPRLDDDAAALLESYPWPGNIRELRNMMERALLLSDGDDIEPDHLPLETMQDPTAEGSIAPDQLSADAPSAAGDDRWNREEKGERLRILDALRAEGGNQTRAARRLGMSRNTLLARLERFEIARPQKRGE